MKHIVLAVFMSSLFLSVRAAEPAAVSPVSDAPAAIKEPKAEAAAPEVQKTETTSTEPAAAEAKPSLKEEVKTPEGKTAPAEISSPIAAESVKDNGAVSVVASTAAVSDPSEAPKTTGSIAVEPTPPVGCVASLQQIVSFHEKEIADLKQRIARWDAKVGVTIKRRQELDSALKAKLKKQEELLMQNTKASKKEANALKKEMTKINRDLQSVDKELNTERKELAAEIKVLSQESSQSLKETCQQAIVDIQKP